MKRLSILAPLLLISALAAAFLAARPLDYLSDDAPPGETLDIETVRLEETGIHVGVRASGSEPLVIAQVQVDGAYRTFSQIPAGSIGYLGTAQIDIPYPWVAGESHHLVILSASGATFEHTVEVAIETPGTDATDLLGLALVGLLVGIVPIMIGFTFYPALVGFGENGRQFAMALTVGLLAFLLADTLLEGLDAAQDVADGLKPELIVLLGGALTCLILLAIGRRGGRPPEGAQLAMFIALGIGVHNLGEGLVIGASFAAGEVALASFLVLGFALHNVTEGIAICAPLRREAVSMARLGMYALIAGGPAIIGTMAGGLAVAPVWTAVAFGIGAGAILQVMIEVGGLFLRRARETGATVGLAGFACGVAIMYATAFVVHG
ncbi:MAG: metal transporter [Rhodospirillales bacterium]|jgi:zinc transporter, ZIP family|nr:metal transporter [Rhodospirillales bacterium]